MKRLIYIILLAVSFTASNSFSQNKNSFSMQTGILNHFYDAPTVLINSDVKFNGKIKSYLNSKLIKSVGIKYERKINYKHSISLSVNNFTGGYAKLSQIKESTILPEITYRKWFFISTQYHYTFYKSEKINLMFGGGINYRKGYEEIFISIFPVWGGVFYEPYYEYIGKEDIGVTLDIGIKYNFWKNFFLHSKIDIQYYFYNKYKVENKFYQEKYWYFKPTKNLNHTFTIGIGIDF